MEDEKKFDSERDNLSPEEMQAMEILDKVYNHNLTAFEGLKEMIKMIEAADIENPAGSEKVPG